MTEVITASHIHVDPSGDVVIGIGSDYTPTGPLFLSKSIADMFPAESIGDLLLGNTYVNIHTEAFLAPLAELRGQLLPMQTSSDSLVNFSTRGMVNPGNGKAALLIGGLALQETKTIPFRMVAESMTRFGVQTGLKDTSFEVFQLPYGELQEAELIGGNDNWKEAGQQFMIAATGYAPEFDNESAWIETLGPGVYTMNANSEQGAGIALVELMALRWVRQRMWSIGHPMGNCIRNSRFFLSLWASCLTSPRHWRARVSSHFLLQPTKPSWQHFLALI